MTGPPADPAGPRPLPTAEDADRLFTEVAPSRSGPSAPPFRLRLLALLRAPVRRVAAGVQRLRTPVVPAPHAPARTGSAPARPGTPVPASAVPVPPRGSAARALAGPVGRRLARPLQVVAVVVWLSFFVWTAVQPGQPDQSAVGAKAPAPPAAPVVRGDPFLVPLDSVPAGSCAVLAPPSGAGSAAVVACTERHDVLVLGRSEAVLPPQQSGAGADAAARCAGLYRGAVPPGRAGGIAAVLPTDAEWAAGRRATVCVLTG